MARLGFESGRFRFGAEYNLVPDSKITYTTTSGSTTSKLIVTSKNNYIGFKIGFVLSGNKN